MKMSHFPDGQFISRRRRLKDDSPESPVVAIGPLGRFSGSSPEDLALFGARVAIVDSKTDYRVPDLEGTMPTLLMANADVIKGNLNLLRRINWHQNQATPANPCLLRLEVPSEHPCVHLVLITLWGSMTTQLYISSSQTPIFEAYSFIAQVLGLRWNI